MGERPPFSIFPTLILPQIFLCLLLSLRSQPSLQIRLATYALLIALSVRGLQSTTGDQLQDYAMGSTIVTGLFTGLYLLFLSDPWKDIRYVGVDVAQSGPQRNVNCIGNGTSLSGNGAAAHESNGQYDLSTQNGGKGMANGLNNSIGVNGKAAGGANGVMNRYTNGGVHSQPRSELDRETSKDEGWWDRMKRAFAIVNGPRGVGWNYQVANIRPEPPSPKWSFVFWRTIQAGYFFVLVDVSQTYILLNPIFSPARGSGVPSIRSIASQGPILRTLSIAANGFTPYGMLNMQYTLMSAISVAIGWTQPEQWPKLFDSFSEAYSVQRFWGNTWHQCMRRLVLSSGGSVANTFGFKRGTLASRFTKLYVAFAVTGIIHSVGGDMMVDTKYLGASLPFFLVQAVAITFEAFVSYLAKSAGLVQDVSKLVNPSSRSKMIFVLSRTIGYIWVFGWLYTTGPLLIDWTLGTNMGRSVLLPVSLVKSILGVHGLERVREGIEGLIVR